MNTRLKKLVQELGEAINDSLSSSEQVARVVDRIKEEGFDLFLVLETTVGVRRHDEQGDASSMEMVTSCGRRNAEPVFHVNASDLRFLKSLKISIDDTA